jgi:hypothetical protein
MTTTRRITAYTVVSIIVNFFMLGAAAISFTHIITASAKLGLVNWQAYTVPFFIDGLAILGMIGRTHSIAARTDDPAATKRFGFRLQLGAGALSLAANVFAGHNLGEKLFGILVVAGFVVTEKYSEKLVTRTAQTAPQITAVDVQAAADAAVAATLAQAAIDTQTAIAAAVTDALAADAADRRKAEQAAKRRDRAAAKRIQQIAPVSPATVDEIDSSLTAPICAYEPAYL